MNTDEWRTFCRHVEECWREPMPEQKRACWRTLLGRLEFQEAMDALVALAENGKPWVTAPEVMAQVRGSDQRSSWPEVWAVLQRALRRGDEESGLALVAEEVGAIPAAFVEAEGYRALAAAPLHDETYGGLRVKELRDRFEVFEAAVIARLRAGLTLEAATSRGGGLRKLQAPPQLRLLETGS